MSVLVLFILTSNSYWSTHCFLVWFYVLWGITTFDQENIIAKFLPSQGEKVEGTECSANLSGGTKNYDNDIIRKYVFQRYCCFQTEKLRLFQRSQLSYGGSSSKEKKIKVWGTSPKQVLGQGRVGLQRQQATRMTLVENKQNKVITDLFFVEEGL